MFQITRTRSGALTTVSVEVADAADLDDVCAAMTISSFTRRSDSLTQVVRCNRRELELVERRLAALLTARRQAPRPVTSGNNVVPFVAAEPRPAQPARSWTRRVMHLDYSPVPPAPAIAGDDGATLRFTGWGRSFICTSELAEPEFQGQAVRYAYYA